MPTNNSPDDLKIAIHHAYKPNGLHVHDIIPDKESQEYGACTFILNNKIIKFRTAKITPTKIGQFVTFWKRMGASPIMPYDISDPFDVLIVSVRYEDQLGQFIFPKKVLLKQNILSNNGNGGKRAVRVYPPWDQPDNAQAKKTQAWQLRYYVEIQPLFDASKFNALLNAC